ncbi:MAG TPA: translation initiation factor 2, partial [Tabrizicola sp.]|nr:translation initiation factor 2 [Tabrizicola sp.]
MKPTFALDLTRETIGLLHRTPKGWLSIGEVAFDAADLPEAMDYLRKTALGLSPLGVATKLILPNSQILYTEIHAPGPSREEKRRQIATALEGRTPYDVADLVFDWSGKGATVKVAVIARETLDQAEGFAVEHRLNPVSFVAIPEEGTFVGEPWFGPTAAAASILAEDETVDRDREPVSILQRELPKTEPMPAVPAAAAPVSAVPGSAAPVSAAPTAPPDPMSSPPAPAEDDLPGLAEALNAELPVEPAPPAAQPPLEDLVEDEPDPAPQAAFDQEPEATLAREAAAALAAAAAVRPEVASTKVEPLAAASVSAAAAPVVEPEEAPFAHVTDTSAFPESDDLPTAPKARKLVADDLQDDIPPAP